MYESKREWRKDDEGGEGANLSLALAMIPVRRNTSAIDPPRLAESIPARLARLRSEQRGARRRFDSPASIASTSRPHLLPPLAPAVETRPTRRATPGPPPPPSWTAAAATDGENRRGTWIREVKASGKGPSPTKERMLAPLDSSQDTTRPSCSSPRPPSLLQCVGEVVAWDLSLASAESLLLEHVHLLPPHLRLRMIDSAAWSWPLEERAIVELLREDEEEGSADGAEGDEAEKEGAEGSATGGEDPEGEWEDDEEDGGAPSSWDVRLGDGRGNLSPFANLTSLNLAYSPIKLGFLRSFLVNQSNPAKPIPSFPHLSTLNLAATPSIQFTEAFFALLSLLISLRHLSLAGKTLDHPSSVTQSTFLPRLAAATPTLLSVDLSYTTWPPILIRAIDWDTRWLDLKQLGMRRDLVDWKGEEIGEAKKDKIRQEVWTMISTGRRRPRRWIEVFV
jgi:hypothetical protein